MCTARLYTERMSRGLGVRDRPASWAKKNEMKYFWKKILEDLSPFYGITNTPVLDLDR